MGCPRGSAREGFRNDSPPESHPAPEQRLWPRRSEPAERGANVAGDPRPAEAGPGMKDSPEHEKARLFERKAASSCRRSPASISGQSPCPPPFIPGPQARAQAGRGPTYKLAPAASREAQEHPCGGERPLSVGPARRPPQHPGPRAAQPRKLFLRRGLRRKRVGHWLRFPAGQSEPRILQPPSLWATSMSCSNHLPRGKRARCAFAYWSEEMSIPDARAYQSPGEAEGGQDEGLRERASGTHGRCGP